MVSREAVQAEARRLVGTPFKHQGRTQLGLDCAGVVIRTAVALGLAHEQWRAYSRRPDGHTLEAILDRCAERIDNPRPGSIMLFRFEVLPQHIAIATERNGTLYMVHSYSHVGRVIEHRMSADWRQALVRAYDWREVA